MKLNLFLSMVIMTILSSCSDNVTFEEETIDGELISLEATITDIESFISANDQIDYEGLFFSTVSNRDQLPVAIARSVHVLYPNSQIQHFVQYPSTSTMTSSHYSVFLSQGLEVVFYQNGYPLVQATLETQFDEDELTGGEMSWWQLLRLESSYKGQIIEEVTKYDMNNVKVDLKNRQSIIVNKMGMEMALGNDDFYDDVDLLLIDPVNLPQIILDYISTNYSDVTIVKAEEYASGYEVTLSNELKLEFDTDGNFIEISGSDDDGEGEGEDIDPTTLPQAILDYIASNYPDVTILEAEVYPNQYEVTLSNGLELEFDLAGNFLEISGEGGDDNQDNDINPANLPMLITNYISTNYPEETIVKAEEYPNGYEVTLSNGLKLEFDLAGNFIEISGNDGDDDSEEDEIDISNLPVVITDYISNNYPDETIVKAEFDGIEYEVTLTNGQKLKFDSSGNFVEISGTEGSGDDENEEINIGSLPMAIINYISMNYPSETIIKAEQYPNGYEVTLSNGLKLEFDLSGNFIEISGNDGDGEGNSEDINPSELPQIILDYIAANYPSATIVEAEQDDEGYEVELSNGVKIEFDLNGMVVEISDSNDEGEDCTDIAFAELPQSAQDYINSNYSGIGLERVRACTTEYRVELSNDVKIKFDLNGNVTEIDD